MLSCEWRNIKSTCFEEHLQKAASAWKALIFFHQILKFSYCDKFLHFLSADFLLRFVFYLWDVLVTYIYIECGGGGGLGQLPPTPKLNLSHTLILTRGQFCLGTIIWLSPNPKTNPDLDRNPNPNQWAIFLGGIVRIPSFC